MNVVRLEAVTKRYGDITALAELSLELESGSTVALLGPNGAGKSTLISLVLGLRRPDAGRVILLDGNPHDPRCRAAVGFAPQEVSFPVTLRVREIVQLVARHFPAAAGTDELLDAFGVLDLGRRQAGGLSGGQRRRLAVALAFLGRPRLVVLDEPTAGLDGEGRRAVWRAIAAARGEAAAVLLATHQLDEAEAVASRVLALARGRLLADGTTAEIRARAGGARVVFRPPDADTSARRWPSAERRADGRLVVRVGDAGRFLEQLVRDGIPLRDVEVAPVTLEEALDVLVGSGS